MFLRNSNNFLHSFRNLLFSGARISSSLFFISSVCSDIFDSTTTSCSLTVAKTCVICIFCSRQPPVSLLKYVDYDSLYCTCSKYKRYSLDNNNQAVHSRDISLHTWRVCALSPLHLALSNCRLNNCVDLLKHSGADERQNNPCKEICGKQSSSKLPCCFLHNYCISELLSCHLSGRGDRPIGRDKKIWGYQTCLLQGFES